MDKEISPQLLKQMLDNNEDIILIDVREEDELNICKLNYSHHIPMRQLPSKIDELDKNKKIVVYCRSGGRSMNCCDFLLRQGFRHVYNLSGGILAWADLIDNSVAKY